MGKVVKVKESDLVNIVEKIVAEAVAVRKQEWLTEQKDKSAKVLEETIKKIVMAELKK
jgi:hypothetical protein